MQKQIPIYIALILSPLVLAFAASHEDLIGVYSNQADGFYVQSLTLSNNGKGYYAAGVANIPVQWIYNEKTDKITIKGNLGANLKVKEMEFTYDPAAKLIHTKEHATLPEKPDLKFLRKEISPELQKGLDTFDWDFAKREIK